MKCSSFFIMALNSSSLFAIKIMSSAYVSDRTLEFPTTIPPCYSFLNAPSISWIYIVNSVGLSGQPCLSPSAVQNDSVNVSPIPKIFSVSSYISLILSIIPLLIPSFFLEFSAVCGLLCIFLLYVFGWHYQCHLVTSTWWCSSFYFQPYKRMRELCCLCARENSIMWVIDVFFSNSCQRNSNTWMETVIPRWLFSFQIPVKFIATEIHIKCNFFEM